MRRLFSAIVGISLSVTAVAGICPPSHAPQPRPVSKPKLATLWPKVDAKAVAVQLPHPKTPKSEAHGENNDQIEAELQADRSEIPIQSPPPDELRRTFSRLEGHWVGQTGFLQVTPLGGNRYKVLFTVSQHCFSWYNLSRSAKYLHGVLVLDRPVKDDINGRYQKLYSVEIDGDRYLIPETSTTELCKFLTPDQKHYSASFQKQLIFCTSTLEKDSLRRIVSFAPLQKEIRR